MQDITTIGQEPMGGTDPLSEQVRGSYEIVVVGAGFSGLGAAYHLRRAGFKDFIVLEKGEDVGGVWRDNTYPGLACDVPVASYSYPFAPWRGFSRRYAPRADLFAYARYVADAFGLRRHVRTGAAVSAAHFDEAAAVWRVVLQSGRTITCRYLINATGFFTDIKFPDIPGLRDFGGKLIHPARWDQSYAAAGRTIAIIGTGATAVQLVPTLAREAHKLVVFQRTPIWVLPKGDVAYDDGGKRPGPLRMRLERELAALQTLLIHGLGFVRYRSVPWLYDLIARGLEKRLRRIVTSPQLQEALLPDYTFFCKRPSFSDEYWQAFNRSNVSLVTSGIRRITPNGVETQDGVVHEVDTLIAATGYELYNERSPVTYPITANGRTLSEFWMKDGFQAYEGVSVTGFPNLFLYSGPYSMTGNTFFDMVENVSFHILRCLKHARERGANRIEVRAEAHERDWRRMLARQKETPILAGQCQTARSYYLNAHGHSVVIRPVSTLAQWLRQRVFSMRDYDFSKTPAARLEAMAATRGTHVSDVTVA